ncbi:MAG: hypothetical protein J3T61_10660 [Candidatus Brocadiales bacterium]|nr:hypothetical protein [Candidatus Bathyanammoxibius sp.]
MFADRYEVQAPLVPHNQQLPAPDKLTDLIINHAWRFFVGDLLTHFAEQLDFTGSDAEIEQAEAWLDALILDFYEPNPGGIVDMKYHGVLVSLGISQAIGAIDEVILVDNTTSHNNHDSDLYFVQTGRIEVPSSELTGYYHVYVMVQLASGTGSMWAWITKSGAKNHGVAFGALDEFHTLRMDTVMFLQPGDVVQLVMRNVPSLRDITTIGGSIYSARLGMFRIGSAT